MNLKNIIKTVENFPKEGISFKDITPVLENPEAFSYTIEEFCKFIKGADKIVGLDARGFLFGGAIAEKLKIPFVIVRKPGKLPGETISIDYELEYGKNTLEIHKNSINKGDKVAIIDDLLATGGTASATIKLIEQLNGSIHSLNFLINLTFLNGEEKLGGNKVNSLVEY